MIVATSHSLVDFACRSGVGRMRPLLAIGGVSEEPFWTMLVISLATNPLEISS